MHVGERLHFRSRLPADDSGLRVPQGRQRTWHGMPEADLRLQGVSIPGEITSFTQVEKAEFKAGLQGIENEGRDQVNRLRAIARKAYKRESKALGGGRS